MKNWSASWISSTALLVCVLCSAFSTFLWWIAPTLRISFSTKVCASLKLARDCYTSSSCSYFLLSGGSTLTFSKSTEFASSQTWCAYTWASAKFYWVLKMSASGPKSGTLRSLTWAAETFILWSNFFSAFCMLLKLSRISSSTPKLGTK